LCLGALVASLASEVTAQTLQPGCYALWARSTQRYLSHNGTSYYLATREVVGEWEKFYLRQTGPNTFAIYDTGRQYMSSNGLGSVYKVTAESTWEQWEITPHPLGDWAIRSVAHNRYLSADASIFLFGSVGTSPNRDQWERWWIGPTSGCAVPPQPSFVSSVAESCYGIYAHATGRFLSHTGTAFYRADRPTVGSFERFYLKATGSNTFVVYSTDASYLSSDTAGFVGKAVKPDTWEEWELIPRTSAKYALRSTAHGHYLSVEATVLWGVVNTKAAAGAWEEFSFTAESGCSTPPESGVNTTAVPQPTPVGQPVWGIADIHSHMFSDEGFGGLMFAGEPFHRFGMDAAIGWCNDNHGPEGAGDVLGNLMDGQLSHHVGGSPQFDGWPRWNDSNHQQMYYKWLERAWRGGLRLQVLLAVNNETLCEESNKAPGYTCNDMAAVDRQLREARDLEDFIDAQSGGPGLGWFRIVRSAAEARQVIQSGKLAIVLGIEVDSLFGCTVSGPCTDTGVEAALDVYHLLGVRHVFPVHVFDNGFGGAALYTPLFNAGNREVNGDWFEARTCADADVDYDGGLGFLDWIITLFSVQAVPSYSAPPGHCNPRGLTTLGEHLLREMMQRHMIIDVDHMSAATLEGTLALAERHGYPMVSGHTGFLDISRGQKASEAQKTVEQVRRIRDLGGLVAPILHQGKAEAVGPERDEGWIVRYGSVSNDCDESSKAWAQAYLYAADEMRGGSYLHAVPLGSDLNGLIHQPAPRFGGDACAGNGEQAAAQLQNTRVSYPFASHDGSGTFDRLVTAQRSFDINTDGLANVGLLPDFVQDLKQVGLSDTDLEPLFRSAEAYLQMWERIDAAADTDGDGILDAGDNCPSYPAGSFADTDGDGRGDECECTDQNGDGHNTVSDLVAINLAIFNPALATPLCDGNNDGLCNVNDIIAANIEIFSPTSTSTCARQPVPAP
jgi:microsomal dipeptidase-like Zn-dependent dipeptidase